MSRYTQAKRHMWGCLDTGYAIRRTIFGLLAPGYDVGDDGILFKTPMVDVQKPKNQLLQLPLSRLFSLFHRLLEAHFILAHVVSIIIISSLLIPHPSHPTQPATFFWSLFTSAEAHPYIYAALEFGGWIRFLAIFPFVTTIFFYEKYHHQVGTLRWNARTNSSKNLGKRSSLQSTRAFSNLLDWTALPICGPLFLTLPQIHAHFIHLFTDKIDYTVAAKPTVLVRSRPLSEIELESIVVEEGPEELQDGKSTISLSSRGDSGFFDFEDNNRSRTPSPLHYIPSPLNNTVFKSGSVGKVADSLPVSWTASI
jgi:hypothetical protein